MMNPITVTRAKPGDEAIAVWCAEHYSTARVVGEDGVRRRLHSVTHRGNHRRALCSCGAVLTMNDTELTTNQLTFDEELF